MAYCTVEEVLSMMKDDLQNILLEDKYIEDDEAKRQAMIPLTEQAILDADNEINGYLSRRYKLPFAETPAVLNKFSKDIALYNLMSRIGIDESGRDKTYLHRYNAAIKFLMAVGKGEIEIGAYSTPDIRAATGFQIRSGRRQFSRETMKGW